MNVILEGYWARFDRRYVDRAPFAAARGVVGSGIDVCNEKFTKKWRCVALVSWYRCSRVFSLITANSAIYLDKQLGTADT